MSTDLDAQQLGHVDPMRVPGLSQLGLHGLDEARRHEAPQLAAKLHADPTSES